MKKVIPINNKEYVITTLEQDGTMQIYLNGEPLETVYYSAARNLYFAPYQVDKEKYWITVHKETIKMASTKGNLTEKGYYEEYPSQAFSTAVQYLYILFFIALPCVLMGIFTEIGVVLLGFLAFMSCCAVLLANKASLLPRGERIGALAIPPVIWAILLLTHLL